MRYYTYLNANEIDLINWGWVYESKETARWDNYDEHFIISFDEVHVNRFENFNGIPVMDVNTARSLMMSEQWVRASDSEE
tara:strand:+ start:83 stop:322 length:240 start_codon:yes stop_codon:yes gene_type:complete